MPVNCCRWSCCFAAVCLLAGNGLAVVTQQSVTPATVKEKDSRVAVEAVKGTDGLVRFTITYRLPRLQHVIAHFELRDGATILATTDMGGFIHEESATYYLAVPARYLKDSAFQLAENGIVESGGRPMAMPGGTLFLIDLDAFGQEASSPKAD